MPPIPIYNKLANNVALNSKAWAEGAEPGGPGTKSAKGWADEAAQSAIYAGGFEVPLVASQAAGNATIANGRSFRVAKGTTPETFDWYQRNLTGSGSVLMDPLATAGSLADAFADAVLASNYPSVEAAHAAAISAGKARVIVNRAWALTANFTATLPITFVRGFIPSCNAFTLTLSGGFEADDTQHVFNAAEAARINLPTWQRITPRHFGAQANYVNAANPGADDGPALNAFASKLCDRDWIGGRYGTTQTILWNGDAGGTASVNQGMKCSAVARLFQRTNTIPIMVVWGSRGVWDFPILEYATPASSTDFGAVGLLVSPYPGQVGWYQNVIGRVMVRGGANVGFFNPPAFSSTTTTTYTAGATSITVVNAQTDAVGTHPWVPGMWINIQMDVGWHITRLSSVAGAVLGLTTAIPAGRSVASGAAVQMTGATAPSTFESAMFSNTVLNVTIDQPTRYGFIDRGTGTGDDIAQMYIRAPNNPADVATPLTTIQRAVYITGKSAGSIQQFNIEYLGFNSDHVYISAQHFRFGEVHIEGCRSYGNLTGVISGTCPDMDFDLVQVEYWTSLATDIATATGIFYPRSVPGTELGSGRGQWRVKQLNTAKNIVERQPPNGRAFVAAYSSGTLTQIRIDMWRAERDGGFYPSGQLTSPSNLGGLVSIGNLLPVDCVAYLFDANANSLAYQRIFTSNKGQFRVREILALHPSVPLTAATAGVYADNTGTTLITNVNNQALSPLTDNATVLSMPIASAEATVLRSGSGNMFFKTQAVQSLPAAVTGASSYLTGRNGGDTSTNLGFINFGSAHGFNVGDLVIVTGSVNTAFNSKQFKIVDVPSTTQIAVYCDSATAVGSPGSPIADAAISVQRVPTLHIVVTGDDFANFNAW